MLHFAFFAVVCIPYVRFVRVHAPRQMKTVRLDQSPGSNGAVCKWDDDVSRGSEDMFQVGRSIKPQLGATVRQPLHKKGSSWRPPANETRFWPKDTWNREGQAQPWGLFCWQSSSAWRVSFPRFCVLVFLSFVSFFLSSPKEGQGFLMTPLPHPPVWNLKAVSLIPLFYSISSLVLLPSPVALSVLTVSWPLFP